MFSTWLCEARTEDRRRSWIGGGPTPHNQGPSGSERLEPLQDGGVLAPRGEGGIDVADGASLGEGGALQSRGPTAA